VQAERETMRFIGRNRTVRRGLTLIESVLAMVLVPMAVLTIALAVTAGQSQAVGALRQARATMLAEALMEEILALPYSDPDGDPQGIGPDPTENQRSDYDNMDDYCGEDADPGGVVDADGNAYPESMQRFARSVSCSATTLNVLGVDTTGLEATVTVTDDGDIVAEVTRFVTDPG
jgi:Tfp pilus assembly protein PilV